MKTKVQKSMVRQYAEAIWMVLKEIILPIAIALSINYIFPIFSIIEWIGFSIYQFRWNVISAPFRYILGLF